MQMKLMEVLACPKCFGELSCAPTETGKDGEIITGRLDCSGCGKQFAITAGIPRFVEQDNYASSFGYQWNSFKAEQIDSINGTQLSAKRFYSETDWSPQWMRGKWVLDVGCGAGRFLDVASQNECEVVGVDLSNATDAARANLKERKNVHLVQASIYELPFKPGAFDGCYCIGVIQHTPDPEKSLRALPKVLKKGGRIAVTIYERRRWTRLNTKYLVRPLTKGLKQQTLLAGIKAAMPVLFPVTEVMFRLPLLGRAMKFAIPVANYVEERELTVGQRYRWAILDTFDMLAPQYDQPQTEEEVSRALGQEGITEIRRLNNGGVNLVGVRQA
jgi:ubiquinone/menaquinone biosynthesis C-methylase UbiE/uncharacterized protein YbaR (Trm112 family)